MNRLIQAEPARLASVDWDEDVLVHECCLIERRHFSGEMLALGPSEANTH